MVGIVKSAYLSHLSFSPRETSTKASLKKEIRVPFRAPLFLGKWYGVAIFFFYTKKEKEKHMTELFSSLIE